MHPRLLWDDIAAAAASVLGEGTTERTVSVELETSRVPGFGPRLSALRVDKSGVSEELVTRVRRTYEWPRLVELAAIATAGLALYHAGSHEIVDVALRGSAADYLVDDAHCRLEVAGRSRRRDLDSAWRQKWERLEPRTQSGCYVCVVEFETPMVRLGFVD